MYLSGNGLSGGIPPELGNLANLRGLWLSDNGLGGEIPPSLGRLADLERLNLSGNHLSGEIPSELGDLNCLGLMYLGKNQLTGCIPEGLRHVRDNDFSALGLPFCDDLGTVASQVLEDRTALVALYNATGGSTWKDNTNWLSDAPMGEWHGVTTNDRGRVSELDLLSNRLRGEIPSELGSLTNLKRLYLASNQLRGHVPSSLGNLTNLTSLILYLNELSGEIPPELGRLICLRGCLKSRGTC